MTSEPATQHYALWQHDETGRTALTIGPTDPACWHGWSKISDLHTTAQMEAYARAAVEANRGEYDCVMSDCPERIGMISHHPATDHYVFSINGEVYAIERGEFEGMVLLLRTLNRADAERLAVTKKFSQYTLPPASAAVTEAMVLAGLKASSESRAAGDPQYSEVVAIIAAALSQGGKP